MSAFLTGYRRTAPPTAAKVNRDDLSMFSDLLGDVCIQFGIETKAYMPLADAEALLVSLTQAVADARTQRERLQAEADERAADAARPRPHPFLEDDEVVP